jgi:hypothetical protein
LLCLLFLSMLGSRFSPDGSRVDSYRIFHKAALVTCVDKRFLNILDAVHEFKLTAAVAHQAFYYPRNWGILNSTHAASLIVASTGFSIG